MYYPSAVENIRYQNPPKKNYPKRRSILLIHRRGSPHKDGPRVKPRGHSCRVNPRTLLSSAHALNNRLRAAPCQSCLIALRTREKRRSRTPLPSRSMGLSCPPQSLPLWRERAESFDDTPELCLHRFPPVPSLSRASKLPCRPVSRPRKAGMGVFRRRVSPCGYTLLHMQPFSNIPCIPHCVYVLGLC